jgi:hypothetical protein
MTADVDVTVEVEEPKLPALVRSLERAGFRSRVEDWAEFARRTRVVPLVFAKNGLPLDLVVSGPGLEERFLERARRVSIRKLRVPVMAPEDLVVVKLLAQRPRDLEDVRGILTRQGDALDVDAVLQLLREIEEALERRDLVDLFERIRRGG